MSLKPLEQEGINLDWKAWQLPDDANPLSKPEGYGEEAKQYINELSKKTGINIVPPTKKRNTFLAHVGGKFAKENGKFADYHKKVFKALWESDKDIEEAKVLIDIASEIGLDSAQFKKALNNVKYKVLVENDYKNAKENQIWTIPSYVGNKGILQVHHFKDIPSTRKLLEIL